MILSTLLCLSLLQAPARPAVGRYTIDVSRSEIGFDGTSTLHDFTGRSRDLAGELRVALGDPSLCTGGSVRVRAKSLDTDSKRRDAKMHELLESDGHRDLVFRLEGASDGLADGRGTTTVHGSFFVREVERPTDVVIEVAPLGDDDLRVAGSCEVAMSDFGISPPRVLFIKAADEVEVWWKLALEPVPAKPVPARSHAVRVVESVERPGEEPLVVERDERLFFTDAGALWDRGAHWQVAGREALGTVALGAATLSAPFGPAESRFRELRAELARLREQAGGDPARAEAFAPAVSRIERSLADAPGTEPAELFPMEDGFALRIGDVTWLEASGRRGEGDLGALLSTLDGLPAAALEALERIDGVPERVTVRLATLSGVSTLHLRIAVEEPGEVPDWSLSPRSWCHAVPRASRAPTGRSTR